MASVPRSPAPTATASPTQAPSFARPASRPSPENAYAAIADSLEAGRREQASELVRRAIAEHPDDRKLQEIAALIDPQVKSPLSDEKLKARAAELLAQQRAPESESPILATPIAWPRWGRKEAPPTAAAAARSPLRRDLAKDAALQMRLGDLQTADTTLTLQIAKDPRDWESYRLRALVRRQLKNPRGALDDAKRALELNPKDAQARGVRALALMDLGREQEALAAADDAVELAPDDANLRYTRAQIHELLGDQYKAMVDLKAAARLDPETFGALYRQALSGAPWEAGTPKFSRAKALYWGAAGLSLLIFSLALFLRRGDATPRPALRAADRAALDTPPAVNGGTPQGFRIVRRVGQGGMGVVYEAIDETLQRKVALKRMRNEIAADPRERRRFLKEARLVAALKHPNIVEIHSVLEHDDALFLVFEFLSGQTLDQALAKGPLPAAEVKTLLRPISSALDHAHSQGVIHQDLKPGNILLAPGAVKVMDFGIARRVQETLSTLSRSEIAGTPAYMAPEQEQGRCGKEADLWAFGVCAYQLLTGHLPFGDSAPFFKKVQKEYVLPSKARPGIPPAVDEVIARALEPVAARRFPCAAEFVETLEKALS